MTNPKKKDEINNQFYDDLGERWYSDDEHIIALLRAEARIKVDYVKRILREQKVKPGSTVLDIACGAGFLSNELARDGWRVSGIDLSANSIEVAARHAATQPKPDYRQGDAYRLPYPDSSFDVALMMDFLEHVDDPKRAVEEAKRVLKPDGLLIFYTFNRTQIARLLAIHAVEFIARDCPKNFHVWRLFIKPQELKTMLQSLGLRSGPFEGLRPRFLTKAFWSTLMRRRVHRDFRFQYCRSLNMGYLGFAVSEQNPFVVP